MLSGGPRGTVAGPRRRRSPSNGRTCPCSSRRSGSSWSHGPARSGYVHRTPHRRVPGARRSGTIALGRRRCRSRARPPVRCWSSGAARPPSSGLAGRPRPRRRPLTGRPGPGGPSGLVERGPALTGPLAVAVLPTRVFAIVASDRAGSADLPGAQPCRRGIAGCGAGIRSRLRGSPTMVPTNTLNDGVRSRSWASGASRSPADDVPDGGQGTRDGLPPHRHRQVYRNEEGVGQAIARRASPAISSSSPRSWATTTTADAAVQALRARASSKLGLDYVDLYLIHWPRPEQDRYVETWQGWRSCEPTAATRSIGVSNFQPAHLTGSSRTPARCPR